MLKNNLQGTVCVYLEHVLKAGILLYSVVERQLVVFTLGYLQYSPNTYVNFHVNLLSTRNTIPLFPV
jgi:hypothetical protein